MKKSQALTHIGFIVDGNRRWAKEKQLPTLEGHKKGLEKVEMLIKSVSKKKIPFTSFYLFSTENWNRSKEEVTYLMELAKKKIVSLGKTAKENDMKCLFLSSKKSRLEESLKKKFEKIEKMTAECKKGTICFCFDYGGKQELADAMQELSDSNEKITPENIEKHLYHPEVPPCDLIVRTSGEKRLSGFMLWRSAYSELLFLEKYWPDIEENDLNEIQKEYAMRSRRYGV